MARVVKKTARTGKSPSIYERQKCAKTAHAGDPRAIDVDRG